MTTSTWAVTIVSLRPLILALVSFLMLLSAGSMTRGQTIGPEQAITAEFRNNYVEAGLAR